MKNNHIAESKIIDYVLNQLSQKEYFQVQDHIQNCSYCSTLVNTWTKTLKNKKTEERLTTLNERVFTSINKAKKKRKYQKISATIVASLLLIIGFSIVQTKKLDQRSPIDQHVSKEYEYIVSDDDFDSFFQRISNRFSKTYNNPFKQINSPIVLTSKQSIINQQLNRHFFLRSDGSLCQINPQQLSIDCYTLIIDHKDQIQLIKRETYQYLNY